MWLLRCALAAARGRKIAARRSAVTVAARNIIGCVKTPCVAEKGGPLTSLEKGARLSVVTVFTKIFFSVLRPLIRPYILYSDCNKNLNSLATGIIFSILTSIALTVSERVSMD
jgi:hypothetical protein